MNRKKLHEILDLVLDLNEQEKTHVFFDFAGHVEGLTVRVYKEGWRYDNEPDLYETIYVDTASSQEVEKLIEEVTNFKEGKTDERKD